MKRIAIAVLHSGNQNMTKETIKGLHTRYPVMVVNNGGEYVNTRADVSVLDIPENKYFSGGWNTFMKWVVEYLPEKYNYVWMLNNDIDGLTKDLYVNLTYMIRKDNSRNIAAYTPSFNSPHRAFHYDKSVRGGLKKTKWVDWCCPIVNIKAWKDIGPFDPNLKGYGADIDWCYRARIKGYMFSVIQTTKVSHIGMQATGQLGTLSKMQHEWEDYLCNKWNVSHWSQLV